MGWDLGRPMGLVIVYACCRSVIQPTGGLGQIAGLVGYLVCTCVDIWLVSHFPSLFLLPLILHILVTTCLVDINLRELSLQSRLGLHSSFIKDIERSSIYVGSSSPNEAREVPFPHAKSTPSLQHSQTSQYSVFHLKKPIGTSETNIWKLSHIDSTNFSKGRSTGERFRGSLCGV